MDDWWSRKTPGGVSWTEVEQKKENTFIFNLHDIFYRNFK
jgi:hypothetical protein